MPTPRLLTPADAAAYFALRQEMLREAPWAFLSSPGDDVAASPETVAAKLAERENSIIGVDDEETPGALVASAGVLRSPRAKIRHRANIWGVYVTPRARGRGLGEVVMRAAIETARAWPGVEVVSLCVTERAASAVALYRSLGFVEWGAEPDAMRINGEALTELHMQMRL